MDEKKLVEYICDGDEMDKIIALCPYKCSDGACVSEPIVETKPITLPKKKTCFLFWCW